MSAVTGFVETFSGDGPYAGLDNPDWFISGDSTFEDGGLRFTNHQSHDQFGRELSGWGSFRATIEFGDLYLGDLDIQSSDDAAGVVGFSYDATPNDKTANAFGVSLSENTGSPPDEWTLVIGASGMSVGTTVPQARMTPVRLEFIYDDLLGELLFTYDHDTSDGIGAMEFGPFPFERNIDESEQHINLLVGACCAFTMQNGLLDYFAVEPFFNLSGDFNGNGTLDVGDIGLLSEAERAPTFDATFDLNEDGKLDHEDRTVWLHALRRTWYGDANLDDEFNSSDIVLVLASGEYDDDVVGNSTWRTGDWDGDGEFTSRDFVVGFADGGYEFGPRAEIVPEPGSIQLATAAAVFIATRRRRRLKTRRA